MAERKRHVKKLFLQGITVAGIEAESVLESLLNLRPVQMILGLRQLVRFELRISQQLTGGPDNGDAKPRVRPIESARASAAPRPSCIFKMKIQKIPGQVQFSFNCTCRSSFHNVIQAAAQVGVTDQQSHYDGQAKNQGQFKMNADFHPVPPGSGNPYR